MFGPRYFGSRYFGLVYWGKGGSTPTIAGIYWSSSYFGSAYFGARYFPGDASVAPLILSFREALVLAMKGSNGIQSLASSRVFPLAVPETSTLPALIYEVETLPRQHSLDGPTGLAEARVKIGAGSRRFSDSVALVEAIRLLFDGFTGSLPGAVTVKETLLDGETDHYDWPDDGSAQGTFWTVQHYTFRYLEAL